MPPIFIIKISYWLYWQWPCPYALNSTFINVHVLLICTTADLEASGAMNVLMAPRLFAGSVLSLDYNSCLYFPHDLLMLSSSYAQIVNGGVNLLYSC